MSHTYTYICVDVWTCFTLSSCQVQRQVQCKDDSVTWIQLHISQLLHVYIETILYIDDCCLESASYFMVVTYIDHYIATYLMSGINFMLCNCYTFKPLYSDVSVAWSQLHVSCWYIVTYLLPRVSFMFRNCYIHWSLYSDGPVVWNQLHVLWLFHIYTSLYSDISVVWNQLHVL